MPLVRPGQRIRARRCSWPVGLAGVLLAASAVADLDYVVPPVARFESPPPGELDEIESTLEVIRRKVVTDFLAARARDPQAIATRDAHAKQHGCVRGEFRVHEELPPRLAVGVFRPGARYAAWIRFSNASHQRLADIVPDARGMAIKLLGVPGPKLLDGVFDETRWFKEEPLAQDFVFINHPVFFVPDVVTYGDFTEALASKRLLALLGFFARHPDSLTIIAEMFSKTTYSPLEIPYHSMTALLLGRRHVAKFSSSPVSCDDGTPVEPTPRPRWARDYLREAMVSGLDPDAGNAVCFDFAAHVRRDSTLSIEDATAYWDEVGAPPVSLATITIEPQVFATPDRMHFCENLSFTPWHAVPAHQPLGGLNRARAHAYKEISELRHRLNRESAIVPSRAEAP